MIFFVRTKNRVARADAANFAMLESLSHWASPAVTSSMPTTRTRMGTSLSIFFLIQQMHRLVMERVDEVLKREDLTSRHFLLLDLLATHEPCSSAELARLARMTAQAMGEPVKQLERRGFLEKTASAEDGRALLIRRSAPGCAAYARCNRSVVQAEQEFFACLDPVELARVRGSLGLVREMEIARRQQQP